MNATVRTRVTPEDYTDVQESQQDYSGVADLVRGKAHCRARTECRVIGDLRTHLALSHQH